MSIDRQSPSRIYHLTSVHQWQEAANAGIYSGDTLNTEGFIHCSTREQVIGTGNRFYSGRRDLVLLEIDPERVKPEIKYEGVPGGEQFPHIYGQLQHQAVIRVLTFQPDDNGVFHSFE